MKNFFILLFSMIITITISACTAEEDVNVLKIISSSDKLVGENNQTVISEFETIGFTNIKTVVLDDLVTGWLTKDGEVEQVEINGKTKFSANTSFPKDAEVIVTYHTFPKKEKGATDSTGEESSVSSEKFNQKTEETILTVNNNEELAAVFKVKDPTDPIVKEFAKKYYGRTIEFDGYIFDSYPHTDVSVFNGKETTYTTIYDVFPIPGNVEDGESTLLYGPTINMERVIISKFPAIFMKNKNVHIVAKVNGYNEKSGHIFLDPISIETR